MIISVSVVIDPVIVCILQFGLNIKKSKSASVFKGSFHTKYKKVITLF